MAKNIWATNGGFYLGFDEYNDIVRYTGERHIVWLGNTGAGKSRRLVLPNLAHLTHWSCIVVDVKGELMRMTLEHRRAAGNEQVVFNPFGLFEVPSRGYNPLLALDPTVDEFLDDAMEQAVGLVQVKSREAHWAESFQDWFAALAMYVRLVIPNGSYADIRALVTLDDSSIKRLIYAGGNTSKDLHQRWIIATEEERKCDVVLFDYNPPFEYKGELYPGMIAAGLQYDWPEIGQKAARFTSLSADNRELHSILSTGQTETRVLDSRKIKREVAGPAFDFAVLKQRPMTVWLVLPDNRLHTHSDWLRLVLNTAIRNLMREAKPGPVPVAIIIDDAVSIGHSPIIEATMAQIRGYGIKLVTIWHDLAEFESIYDKTWESLVGNAGVLQSFAAQDVKTGKYLSERTGFATGYFDQHTTNLNLHPQGKPSSSMSSSRMPHQKPLMLPQEIWAMAPGETILFSHQIGRKIGDSEITTGRIFAPWPTKLPGLGEICALDPAVG